MTNTDRLDADPVEPIRLAALDIVKAKSLAVVLFDHSVAYTDFRYEAAQQINALVLTVSNLEFEIETYKKWLEQSDAKSEVLSKERDEARQDAARYRWLKGGGLYALPSTEHGLGEEYDFREWDQLIEAKMKEKTQ